MKQRTSYHGTMAMAIAMAKTIAMAMAIAMVLTGCIDEYEADIASEYADLLVVEGTIVSARQNVFVLSLTQPLNSSYTPRRVTGATVVVCGSDGSVYAAQEADGEYACTVGDLDPDATYWLHIEADGEVYESEPQKPLRTEQIDVVNVVQATPESDIDVLITPEAPADPDAVNYYSWTYDETWEVRPDYTSVIYFDTMLRTAVFKPDLYPMLGWMLATSHTITVATSLNYEGQHIRRLKLYGLDRGDERVFYRYSGLVHQRAITKAEYEYDRARRQAGTEMGGLFTPLPSALPTNIRCLTSRKHVIGFVGCALNTSEYRFFVDAVDFSIDHPWPRDSRQWLDDCNELDCLRMANSGLHLCEWIDERDRPQGKLRTAWAYDFQLDVRLKGATDVEPDYWSLDEDVRY